MLRAAPSRRANLESNGAREMPNLPAFLRFVCLLDENIVAEPPLLSASARLRGSARARGGANAPLYTKLSGTAVNFFPLVYFGCQCSSIRDCTVPISPSTQARRAAMAKKRKAKAAGKAKKTKRRKKK
jgi:hypothetical protein